MKKFQLLALAMLSVFALNAGINQQTPNYNIEDKIHKETTEAVIQGDKVDSKTMEAIASPLAINELNTPSEAQSYPWISNDGLSLYYTHDRSIYVATRTKDEEHFGKGITIFPNFKETAISGWLTSDELTIYVASQNSKLYKAIRKSKTENFDQMEEITLVNAPAGSLFDASFTPDMTELYLYNNDNRERIVKFVLSGNNQYTFDNELNVLSDKTPTGGQLSKDGLRFYVPLKGTTETGDDFRVVYYLSRPSLNENFNAITMVKTEVPVDVTAYQPCVTSDGTKMVFVTGADNLWDHNDLCMVNLVEEMPQVVCVIVPAEPVETLVQKEYTSFYVEEIGDVNSGNTAVFISSTNNSTIYDYTGNTTPPDGYVLISQSTTTVAPVNNPVVVENTNSTRVGLVMPEMRIAPNPFSEATQIEIVAPEGGYMTVGVYTMDGQLAAVLYDGQAEKGINIIKWVKNGLSGGVYTVKAVIGSRVITKKVITCDGTN